MRTFALFTKEYCPFRVGEWVEKTYTRKTICYKSVTTRAEVVIETEIDPSPFDRWIGDYCTIINLDVKTETPLIDQLERAKS
jgi:hypothetical protein